MTDHGQKVSDTAPPPPVVTAPSLPPPSGNLVAVYWRPVLDGVPRGPWLSWGQPWVNGSGMKVTARSLGVLIPELGLDAEFPLDVPMKIPTGSWLSRPMVRWETPC